MRDPISPAESGPRSHRARAAPAPAEDAARNRPVRSPISALLPNASWRRSIQMAGCLAPRGRTGLLLRMRRPEAAARSAPKFASDPLLSSLPHQHEDFLSGCRRRMGSGILQIERPYWYAEMRILIVEDDRKLARQLKKGVDEFGHTTTLAFDGREGLEAAQGSEFDVLVLDVMLPR